MTLREVRGVNAAWAKFPPAHIALRRVESLLRAFMGVPEAEESSPPRRDSPPLSYEDMKAMAERLNAGVRVMG
jgi:hypothetical protein